MDSLRIGSVRYVNGTEVAFSCPAAGAGQSGPLSGDVPDYAN